MLIYILSILFNFFIITYTQTTNTCDYQHIFTKCDSSDQMNGN